MQFQNLRYIFESENVLQKIACELERQPADCVFIDAFADLYDGELNQTNKIRTFLNKYADLAKKYKCLFIILHHCGKRTEEYEPSKNNLLGSQGFEAKVRLVIELRKDYTYPSVRHFCIVKGNYLDSEFKQDSYALQFDENMVFTALNRRVPFAMLSKQVNTQAMKSDVKDKVIKYKEQGLTIRKIAETLKSEGIDISKSTVGTWIKSCPSNPNGLETKSGQDNN